MKTLRSRLDRTPERTALWKADSERGTRQERGYGYAWEKLRAEVLERDHGLCQPCLKLQHVTKARAVDHKIPKSQGGTDDLENLQAICDPCHDAKTRTEMRGGG